MSERVQGCDIALVYVSIPFAAYHNLLAGSCLRNCPSFVCHVFLSYHHSLSLSLPSPFPLPSQSSILPMNYGFMVLQMVWKYVVKLCASFVLQLAHAPS